MPRSFRACLTIALIPLLGACAATAIPPATSGSGTSASRPGVRSAPPPQVAPAPSTGGFRAPRVMNDRGLESVIGANAAGLERQFGPARLNVIEGDVRKLQFGGEACVLDIYLYPLSPGAEPTATYVDARRSSDGLDVDRSACAAALKR